MVTGTTVIDVLGCVIYGISAVSIAYPCDAFVVAAYQAISTSIGAVGTPIGRSDLYFYVIAICRSVTSRTLSILTNLAIWATMVTGAAVIQIALGVAEDASTHGIADALSRETYLSTVTGMSAAAAVVGIRLHVDALRIFSLTAQCVTGSALTFAQNADFFLFTCGSV